MINKKQLIITLTINYLEEEGGIQWYIIRFKNLKV